VTRPDLFVRMPGWHQGSADHVHVEVRPLSELDMEQLLRGLLRRVDKLPQNLLDHIVGMTGGNPFFAHQLVHVLLAKGIITVKGDKWLIDTARASTVQLPVSVEEAVAARIAALEPEERDLLEKAGALGAVFWTGALIVLTRLNREFGEEELHDNLREEIDSILKDLVERDYLLHMPDSTIPGEEEYAFKHNLEREFVVKATPPERAKRYRLFAAQWLETRLVERNEETLEFLASLYEQGGNTRRGAYYYITAADKARSRHANELAARLYEKGLSLLEFDDAVSKVEALHNCGDVLVLLGKTGQALERFAEMLRYAWLLDHASKAGAAHSRIGRIYRQTCEYDKAALHLNLALQFFTRAGDTRGVAATYDDIGKLHFLRGDLTNVLELMNRGLVLRRQLGDRRSIAVSLANIGRVHHSTGQFGPAVECLREALDLFQGVGDQQGQVSTLLALAQIHTGLGEHKEALDMLKEAFAIASAVGDRLSQASLLAAVADAQMALGQPVAAIESVKEALSLAVSLGDKRLEVECLRRLGEMFLERGDVSAAREKCEEAVALAAKIGLRVEHAVAQRALATVLMHPSFGDVRLPEAERLLEESIRALVEAQDEPELAKSYEVLARLFESTGEVTRASELRRGVEDIKQRLRGAVRASTMDVEIDVDLSDVEKPK